MDSTIERGDGRVLAVEVKLNASVQKADVRHLHRLKQSIGDERIDAIVVTTALQAYRGADGIAVV